jgi:glycosyltransferase involved in cell wall biosynthesis
MPMAFSVVICTHNPRHEILQRTVSHLRAQDSAVSAWEFLLIDNASNPAIESTDLVTWHPRGRLIREERVGHTWARYRAFQEATAEWIVFVDDDNLLSPDYLSTCADLCAKFPQLGVFGSSSIHPEFEREPDAGTKPFLPFLALRDGKKAAWSNQCDFAAFPCGAGMAIRRRIGLEYYDRMKATAAMDLGRKGSGMNAGDDTALVLAVLTDGLGTGVFPDLRLTHVIPKSRLDRHYLRQLATGISRSLTRLKFDLGMQPRSLAGGLRMCISGGLQMLRHPHQWSFQWCILKGQIQAWLQRP